MSELWWWEQTDLAHLGPLIAWLGGDQGALRVAEEVASVAAWLP